MLCIAGSALLAIGQTVGIIPDDNATKTAKTQATAAVLALTPSSTPTLTPSPTNTPRATFTSLPSDTPQPPWASIPTVTRLPITELPMSYYYVLVRANLRPCPRTTDECAPVAELSAGDSVFVTGQMTGQAISGNDIWYQVSYRGQTLYAHSSVLSDRPPSAPEPSGGNSGGQKPVPTTVSVDPFGCNGINDLDCSDFNRLGLNANTHLALCGDEDNLDGDGDGRACEDW
jgi:hypothetical protein